MVVKLIGTLIFSVILFYAVIGVLFMHGTKYDYQQSIKTCQEMVRAYPDNAIITGTPKEK